jgi:hypothetical protein
LTDEEHTTRTIRIDSDLDDILRDEAENNGLSVNSIIEELITRYVYNDRFFSSDQVINLAPSTLSSLLNGLSKEYILESGRQEGKISARTNLLIRGLPLSYESLKWFIMTVLERYRCWFKCSYHEMDDFYMFHLRHNHGEKWSCFIAAYLEATVKDILDIDVDAEMLGDTVTLRIPMKLL